MPVQKDFPYLKAINHHLSSMEETGVLTKLRNKWLHARELTKEHICQNAKTGNQDTSGYDNVEWGNVIDLFWLLLFGIAGCAIVAALEKLTAFLSNNITFMKLSK